MKKHIFILLAFISFNLISQIEDPVDWTFFVEKIQDNDYNLVIEAKIEKGWNVYSQHVDPDGPIPTTFSFKDSPDYKLIDSVQESNTITKFDPVFQMNLASFQKEATFTQKVKILSDTISSIMGELEFMACNSTMCLPPEYVTMIFDFKKKKFN